MSASVPEPSRHDGSLDPKGEPREAALEQKWVRAQLKEETLQRHLRAMSALAKRHVFIQ